LARLFATKYPVIGFDMNQASIDELNNDHDSRIEVEDDILQDVLIYNSSLQENSSDVLISEEIRTGLLCSSNLNDIADANIYIITVPTPVDKHNKPDLTPLYKASETVGNVLKKGNIVIYESTVYPGATEEECIPVLE